MELILDVIIILLAIFIAYQDITQRKVLLIALVGFIIILVFKAVMLSLYVEVLLFNRLINLLIVGVLILLLWMYFKFLRKRKLAEVIGMGDILLFISFAIAFEAEVFIPHLTLSLIFSLLFHFLFKNYYDKEKTIPLAGFMCIYFIGILIAGHFHFEIPLM